MATTNQGNPFPLTERDLVDLDDASPQATETTSEAQNYAQDQYHWLITPPTQNLDDPTRGVGVYQYLGGTEEQLLGLKPAIETDWGKDFRTLPGGVEATITQTATEDGAAMYLIQVVAQTIVGVVSPLYGYTQANGLQVLNPGY